MIVYRKLSNADKRVFLPIRKFFLIFRFSIIGLICGMYQRRTKLIPIYMIYTSLGNPWCDRSAQG
jgi:hypothetical protein